MSVLIFIEIENNELTKSTLEAVSYGVALGKQLGVQTIGSAIGEIDETILAGLGKYGLENVIKVTADTSSWTASAFATATFEIVKNKNSTIVILPSSSLAEGLSARLAAKMDASIATNVIGLPDTSSGFSIKKGIFTGKAFAHVQLSNDKKVLTIKKNSFGLDEISGSATVEAMDITTNTNDIAVKILETKKSEGTILLPDADIVISAGRGLKGPENWKMVEELANVLGAATACSKPVSDADWRPHHEHVGQTGIKVSPNLYIAIGISGAIQHLAGVSSSKTIVVINTDEDAPFFKAADYGIVGDAFEVVPRLIESFKKA